jgi:hypothetical protein
MASYHIFNTQQLQYIYRSPQGPMARHLLKQGIRVQSGARKNLNGGVSGPRRINTGLLRSTLSTQLGVDSDGLVVRVGSKLKYALFVHEGTGLYGPKRQVIRPKNGKFLVFKSKKSKAKSGKWKGKVVVPYVKGIKPNRFLTTALNDVIN